MRREMSFGSLIRVRGWRRYNLREMIENLTRHHEHVGYLKVWVE